MTRDELKAELAAKIDTAIPENIELDGNAVDRLEHAVVWYLNGCDWEAVADSVDA